MNISPMTPPLDPAWIIPSHPSPPDLLRNGIEHARMGTGAGISVLAPLPAQDAPAQQQAPIARVPLQDPEAATPQQAPRDLGQDAEDANPIQAPHAPVQRQEGRSPLNRNPNLDSTKG